MHTNIFNGNRLQLIYINRKIRCKIPICTSSIGVVEHWKKETGIAKEVSDHLWVNLNKMIQYHYCKLDLFNIQFYDFIRKCYMIIILNMVYCSFSTLNKGDFIVNSFLFIIYIFVKIINVMPDAKL